MKRKQYLAMLLITAVVIGMLTAALPAAGAATVIDVTTGVAFSNAKKAAHNDITINILRDIIYRDDVTFGKDKNITINLCGNIFRISNDSNSIVLSEGAVLTVNGPGALIVDSGSTAVVVDGRGSVFTVSNDAAANIYGNTTGIRASNGGRAFITGTVRGGSRDISSGGTNFSILSPANTNVSYDGYLWNEYGNSNSSVYIRHSAYNTTISNGWQQTAIPPAAGAAVFDVSTGSGLRAARRANNNYIVINIINDIVFIDDITITDKKNITINLQGNTLRIRDENDPIHISGEAVLTINGPGMLVVDSSTTAVVVEGPGSVFSVTGGAGASIFGGTTGIRVSSGGSAYIAGFVNGRNRDINAGNASFSILAPAKADVSYNGHLWDEFSGSNSYVYIWKDTTDPYGLNSPDRNVRITGFVTRLYVDVLGRRPVSSEMQGWVNALGAGTITATQAAYGFFFSDEAVKYKNLGNADFVEGLYRTMLGRASDAPGKAGWVAALDTGMPRENIFYGFANSIEFGNICTKIGITR